MLLFVEGKMDQAEIIGVFERIKPDVEEATKGVVIETETFKDYYLPLIMHYIDDRENKGIDTYVIGVQGCQGVGKTVLTTLIKLFLEDLGYKVKGFSIDDFYKSNDERLAMTEEYEGNPFYQISRGLPGTHRHEELYDVLQKAKNGKDFDIPDFDKSKHGGRGDITDIVTEVREQQDFVIFEGWCVLVPYVEANEFIPSMAKNGYVNNIFFDLDQEKKHFKDVMKFVKEYQKIWGLFDNRTIMLGKEIEWIEGWRAEQEDRMIASGKPGMTREQIHEFVMPYIPFTHLIYEKIAKTEEGVDCLLTVEWDHIPDEIKIIKK